MTTASDAGTSSDVDPSSDAGTSSDADPSSDAGTSSTPASTGDANTCDGMFGCVQCEDCAIVTDCNDVYNECNGSLLCGLYYDCLVGCVEYDTLCRNGCVLLYPIGAQLYKPVKDCTCGLCPQDCGGVPSYCD